MRTLNWFFRLSESKFMQMLSEGEIDREMNTVATAFRLSTAYNSKVLDEYLPVFQNYYKMLYTDEQGNSKPQ